MTELILTDKKGKRIEEGSIIILISDWYNKNKYETFIKEFKGIPFVLKYENNKAYFFWQEHDLKFMIDSKTKHLFNHSRYKYFNNVNKKKKNYVERSGYNNFTKEFSNTFIEG